MGECDSVGFPNMVLRFRFLVFLFLDTSDRLSLDRVVQTILFLRVYINQGS